MAAVVRPVGIDHADLGERRIAPLALEVRLTEGDIVLVHRKRVLLDEVGKPLFVQRQKARERRNFGGNGVIDLKRRGNGEGSFPALHGVDDVLLDRLQIALRNGAVDGVHLRRADDGTALKGHELDALCRGVRALVKLTGQVLDGEHARAHQVDALARHVHLRLGEHRPDALPEELQIDILSIVAIEDADLFHAADVQKLAHVRKQRARLVVKALFLLNVDPVNHFIPPLMRQARACRYPCACMRFQR